MKLDDRAKRPPAKLDDLAWLTGHWVGIGFGAQVYEIITVVADGSSLGMRLKHFTGSLKSWEEKEAFVSFPLVKLEGRTAWFDGMTYQLDADGTLRVWLTQGLKEGPPEEGEIVSHRQT